MRANPRLDLRVRTKLAPNEPEVLSCLRWSADARARRAGGRRQRHSTRNQPAIERRDEHAPPSADAPGNESAAEEQIAAPRPLVDSHQNRWLRIGFPKADSHPTGVSANEWPILRPAGCSATQRAASLARPATRREFGQSVADTPAPRKAPGKHTPNGRRNVLRVEYEAGTRAAQRPHRCSARNTNDHD